MRGTTNPLLAGALAAAFTFGMSAAALEETTWQRDSQLIENGLTGTLDKSFLESRAREDWNDFYQQFESGLDRYEGLVSPESLRLMREINEQLRLQFDTIDKTEKWQDASYFIRSKVVYSTFVLHHFATALEPAEWERDAQLVSDGLIRTVDDYYDRANSREDWEDYHGRFLEGLQRFDGVISPNSLALFREIAEQLQQSLSSIENARRWHDASEFLRAQIVFTSFVLRAYSGGGA